MNTPILIVGQGLAGTVLGLALEQAGIGFRIVDAGHAGAASAAAAGIINPIAGRRLVRTPRIGELLPLARTAYRELEVRLGVPLWRELRVRRLFRDERERRIFLAKQAGGELAPFAGEADAAGFWIAPAARVDVPALLAAARARWLKAGLLREAAFDWARRDPAHELVIDCTGAAARRGPFAGLKFEWSKGETLQIALPGLDPDVIVNRGHWLLPLTAETAWVGATHEPGVDDTAPPAAARALLLDAAAGLAAAPVQPRAQFAGVRLTTRDKLPVAGRHPADPRRGICAALGGRGALFAPWLARQWVEHLRHGRDFDPAVAVVRPVAAG
ncbi:MAG: FAD-binding oxidoreductase [Opitutaceae bacterium]|nr:FAD-binding oxidoreductase [Opitutaceae bacterium]